MVLEKTLESPLDCKENKPVILKKINPEYSFIGRTEAEAPILWPPDANSCLFGKDADALWGRLRAGGEGATEVEMVGQHH